MEVITTKLDGVLRLRPKAFHDERGFFLETWNAARFNAAVGRDVDFVQDNVCCSGCGVLRGLHYQAAPAAQGKLIRVVSGRIFDVAVDVRPESSTYGSWEGHELDGMSQELLWIPEGFAHGFLVLSDEADVFYKATSYYSPQHERCICWDDSDLGIEWPSAGSSLIVSAKDAHGMTFRNLRDAPE